MNEQKQFINEELTGKLEADESIELTGFIYTGPGMLVRVLSRLSFGLLGFFLLNSRSRVFYAAATNRRILLIETEQGWFSSGMSSKGIHTIGYKKVKDVEDSSFLNHRKIKLHRTDGLVATLRANLLFNSISETGNFFRKLPDKIKNYSGDSTGDDEITSPADSASVFTKESVAGKFFLGAIKWVGYAIIFLLVMTLPASVWYNNIEFPHEAMEPGKYRLNIISGGPGGSYKSEIYGYEEAVRELRTLFEENTSPSRNPFNIIWQHIWYNLFMSDYDMKFTLEDDTGGYSRFPIFYMSGNTIFVRGMSFLSYKEFVLSSDISAAELRKRLTPLMEAKKR